MLVLQIPGQETIRIQHLVLDYNGTLAVDGNPVEHVESYLENLSKILNIHILTADTFGTVNARLAGLPCKIHVLPPGNQDLGKLKYVKALGLKQTLCIGNGRNDYSMVKSAALGIAVIMGEGASSRTIFAADVVCTDITHAFELIMNPKRLAATLRT
jgi:soluble P-type ATPase